MVVFLRHSSKQKIGQQNLNYEFSIPSNSTIDSGCETAVANFSPLYSTEQLEKPVTMNGNTNKMLLAVAFSLLFSVADSLTVSYCSPDNTGADYSSKFDTFQSDGLCTNTCQSDYAFAVLQGSYCWCSNYVPANTVDSSSCNQPCPGYPDDTCGSVSSGLYGYFALSMSPSGTAGGSTSAASTTQPTSSFVETSSAMAMVTSTSSTTPTTFATSTTPTYLPTTEESSSASPTPSTSEDSAPSTHPSRAPSVYTSVITLTGQPKTIVVTPTPSATSDPSLGQSASNASNIDGGSGGGVSKGTVIGVVVGACVGIGLIVSYLVWFFLRRKQRLEDEANGVLPPYGGDTYSRDSQMDPSRDLPSRQMSQMSSAGLISHKTPRVKTSGFGVSTFGRSPDSAISSNGDRRSLGTDQRLNPHALYSHDDNRHSNVSLQDNQDYSRQLRVANPDP